MVPSRAAKSRFVQKISEVIRACRRVSALRRPFSLFVALTVMEQFFPVALIATLATGLGLTISPSWLFSGLLISLIVARLPISIDGIGVFDVVFATLMTLGGVPPAASVAMAFAGRILQVVACAPWAIRLLWSRQPLPATSTKVS
jgi:uncharacterized membrane protein YbhN (UPF0104 family)